MKSKILAILLTILGSTNVIFAQSIAKTTESRLHQAKKSVEDRFKHLKKCLAGKEPCSKLDFVMIGSSVAFLYAILAGLRAGLIGQPKSVISKIPYYIDPLAMTAEITAGATQAAKRRIHRWRYPELYEFGF